MSDARGRQTIDLPPMRNLGELPPDPYSRPPARLAVRSLVGVLLVLTLFLLLAALSLANITAEGPAKRGLRNSIAVLTEVDAYLEEHWPALRDEAVASPPESPLMPAEFPVAVTVTAQEVLDRDREAFRALLLTRAAERVYHDGADAFQGEASDPSALSLEGAARNGLDFLRPRPHDVFTFATLAAAVASGLLAAALVLLSRGYGRLLALGITVTVAAVPFLLLAIGARFALRLAADNLDDAAVTELLKLGQELSWAGIRNGMVFSVGGGVLLVLGAWLTRWPPGVSRPQLS